MTKYFEHFHTQNFVDSIFRPTTLIEEKTIEFKFVSQYYVSRFNFVLKSVMTEVASFENTFNSRKILINL